MRLTAARREALRVLAAQEHANRMKRPERQRCRISNETSMPRGDVEGYIYWQSANWLEENGLAAKMTGSYEKPGMFLRLTAEGRALAKKEKLWPSA